MSPALLLILLSALPAPAPATTGAAVFPPPAGFAEADESCPRARVRLAQRPQAVRPQRLIDLPPGRLELTVLRELDGCAIPAVLREGIGAAAPAEGRPAR